jgi:hypothetical protein
VFPAGPEWPLITFYSGLTEANSRDGRERRYISLFGKDFAALPLKRIIVGPSGSQDDNATFAQKIVDAKVPVCKSATPYIA